MGRLTLCNVCLIWLWWTDEKIWRQVSALTVWTDSININTWLMQQHHNRFCSTTLYLIENTELLLQFQITVFYVNIY